MKGDSQVVFLFINEDNEPEKGRQYLKKQGFAIPFYTQAGDLPEEIFSGTLPTTVVINKEGVLVMKHQGMAGYDNEKFISQLKGLP